MLLHPSSHKMARTRAVGYDHGNAKSEWCLEVQSTPREGRCSAVHGSVVICLVYDHRFMPCREKQNSQWMHRLHLLFKNSQETKAWPWPGHLSLLCFWTALRRFDCLAKTEQSIWHQKIHHRTFSSTSEEEIFQRQSQFVNFCWCYCWCSGRKKKLD